MLARQDSLEAFFDQPLAGAVDRRRAAIQSFHDAAVAPAHAHLGNISLEQNPRLQDLGGGVLAFADQGFEGRSFLCAQTEDVFFDRSL
jgi:hypothetical protein